VSSPTDADATALPVDRDLLDFAVDVAREAGESTLRWFQTSDLTVDSKADGTPVTAADRRAERLVRERIAARFPDDGVLGEEEPEAAIGVIVLPALGQAVYAGRGLGAWWDGEAARVSTTSTLDGAYLSSSSFSHWPDGDLLGVKHAGCELRTWGDGYGYSLVASGRLDAMVDHVVEVYDVAPMPVILAEAGGRFTSFAGTPGAAGGSGVATNGTLHDELLAVLAG
jgi:histidinol-phosphatase